MRHFLYIRTSWQRMRCWSVGRSIVTSSAKTAKSNEHLTASTRQWLRGLDLTQKSFVTTSTATAIFLTRLQVARWSLRFTEILLIYKHLKSKIMIKFKSTSPMGSDCTTAYDVETDCKTIGEFVNEVLKRGESGFFKIGSWSGEKYEYKGSNLLTPMPQGLLSRRIGKIQASGGWSQMSYCFR